MLDVVRTEIAIQSLKTESQNRVIRIEIEAIRKDILGGETAKCRSCLPKRTDPPEDGIDIVIPTDSTGCIVFQIFLLRIGY